MLSDIHIDSHVLLPVAVVLTVGFFILRRLIKTDGKCEKIVVLGGISGLIQVVPWQTNRIFVIQFPRFCGRAMLAPTFLSDIITRTARNCQKGFSWRRHYAVPGIRRTSHPPLTRSPAPQTRFTPIRRIGAYFFMPPRSLPGISVGGAGRLAFSPVLAYTGPISKKEARL